jgi:hypothetical protein
MKITLMILLLSTIVFIAQFGGPLPMKTNNARANRRAQK